jgi:hypothetical protein
MLNIRIYNTHDNGDRPFSVEIRDMSHNKYIVKVSSESNVMVFDAVNVFVGTSPLNLMTEFSGGHGDKFDGNSILINTKQNEYIFIGDQIFRFNTESPVISYMSPIGNNDVPYPFAILENGEIYLMIENVVLTNTNSLTEYLGIQGNDPYSYYYDNHYITPNMSIYRTEDDEITYLNDFPYYNEIKAFQIGGERYNMTYNANLEEDYDRLKEFENTEGDGETQLEIFVGENLNKIVLTKEMYVEIVESFGNSKGFRKFNKNVLHERVW